MKKSSSKQQFARSALQILEELLWSLSSTSPADLRKGISALRGLLDGSRPDGLFGHEEVDSWSARRRLVGLLPDLLSDELLFPSNQDIEKFSREALAIEISRWEKRSRYEMIGMLVMEARLLPEEPLQRLVGVLAELLQSSDAAVRLRADAQKTGFSWNEAIRKLREN